MKNWKTTISGCALAIVLAVQPIISTGAIDWKQAAIAALVAMFSFVAKDNDVTGGTKFQ